MAGKQVWAIDIGETALKAARVRKARGRLEVLAFDVVVYEQALSAPGVDADAQVRQALATFVRRNAVNRHRVVATISARSALIRFIKLPPVDSKKIGDVVQYEASQHIPFPLDEVVWDYQPMRGGQVIDFEVEVGMFAMRREIVRNFLTNLLVVGLPVDKLQLTPIALCNFVYYDYSPKQALVVLDVGASNSRLLVVDGESVWFRNLTIGGNDFTKAIATKYKISFPKAEVLKCRGSSSEKYALQVFDALRTPARNLVDEVQRSLGFYKSTQKEAKIQKMLLMGSSFALDPLARFVGVSLGLEAEVFAKPKKVFIEGAAGLDNFKKYAASFPVALGLAVEELGLGIIETNMLPKEIVRKKALGRKQPFAVAAAALILASVLTPYFFTKNRISTLASSGQKAPAVIDDLRKLEMDIRNTKTEASKVDKEIQDLYTAGVARRDIWLDILEAINTTIPSENPESAILLVRLTSEVTEVELGAGGEIVGTVQKVETEAELLRKSLGERIHGQLTEEQRRQMELEEAEEELKQELLADEIFQRPENLLRNFGHMPKLKWERMPKYERASYVRVLEDCEKKGIIKVNWGTRKGESWPTWEYLAGYNPDMPMPGGGAPGGGGLTGIQAGGAGFGQPAGGAAPVAYRGIRNIIDLKLSAERRALTKNLSDAVREIDNQFVKTLSDKYPFFTKVKMVNPMRVTYVEDMDGYRLGKRGEYKPSPQEQTQEVEWITFDILITVDPSKGGLATAAASTAATS